MGAGRKGKKERETGKRGKGEEGKWKRERKRTS